MWRTHPDYPNYLEVSDAGEVRSLTRKSPKGRTLQGKVLRPSKTRDGHLRVGVTTASGTRHVYVHVLVLETFVGPRPAPNFDARHLNGIPSDNRLSNLAWGTKRQNRLDDLANGVTPGIDKTHCPYGHEYTPENNTKSKYAAGNGSGQKTCRACSNARSYARRHNLPFDPKIADAYYERIKTRAYP